MHFPPIQNLSHQNGLEKKQFVEIIGRNSNHTMVFPLIENTYYIDCLSEFIKHTPTHIHNKFFFFVLIPAIHNRLNTKIFDVTIYKRNST